MDDDNLAATLTISSATLSVNTESDEALNSGDEDSNNPSGSDTFSPSNVDHQMDVDDLVHMESPHPVFAGGNNLVLLSLPQNTSSPDINGQFGSLSLGSPPRFNACEDYQRESTPPFREPSEQSAVFNSDDDQFAHSSPEYSYFNLQPPVHEYTVANGGYSGKTSGHDKRASYLTVNSQDSNDAHNQIGGIFAGHPEEGVHPWYRTGSMKSVVDYSTVDPNDDGMIYATQGLRGLLKKEESLKPLGKRRGKPPKPKDPYAPAVKPEQKKRRAKGFNLPAKRPKISKERSTAGGKNPAQGDNESIPAAVSCLSPSAAESNDVDKHLVETKKPRRVRRLKDKKPKEPKVPKKRGRKPKALLAATNNPPQGNEKTILTAVPSQAVQATAQNISVDPLLTQKKKRRKSSKKEQKEPDIVRKRGKKTNAAENKLPKSAQTEEENLKTAVSCRSPKSNSESDEDSSDDGPAQISPDDDSAHKMAFSPKAFLIRIEDVDRGNTSVIWRVYNTKALTKYVQVASFADNIFEYRWTGLFSGWLCGGTFKYYEITDEIIRVFDDGMSIIMRYPKFEEIRKAMRLALEDVINPVAPKAKSDEPINEYPVQSSASTINAVASITPEFQREIEVEGSDYSIGSACSENIPWMKSAAEMDEIWRTEKRILAAEDASGEKSSRARQLDEPEMPDLTLMHEFFTLMPEAGGVFRFHFDNEEH